MDKNNFNDLQKLQKKAQNFHLNQPIGTLLAFDTIDVADPYYGNLDDFRQMFVQIQKLLITGYQFGKIIIKI